MNREEQQLIEDLFARLRNYGGGDKDPDAEALINSLIRRTPDAPYYLAQTVIVQQQALERAEARMRNLEQAAAQASRSSSGRGGSFLPGGSVPASGGSSRGYEADYSQPPRAQQDIPARPSSPWASSAQASSGAGGFLSSALTTAAGVAGGVFLADGIRSLFGGGNAFGSGGRSASDQATIDRLQDETQDARDDADQSQKDLAADDAELDRMQDAQDDQDDYEDTWADDDSLDV